MMEKIRDLWFILLLCLLVVGIGAGRYMVFKAQVAHASAIDVPTFYPSTFCVNGYVFVGVRMGGNGVDIEQVFEQYAGGHESRPMKCK